MAEIPTRRGELAAMRPQRPRSSKERREELASFRRRVIAAVAAETDKLVAAQLRSLRKNVPEYRALSDGGDSADLRLAVKIMTSAVLLALAEERGLSPEEIAAARAAGARRAQQGISSQVLAEGARTVMKAGWDYLAGIVGSVPDPDGCAAEAVSKMSRDFVDLMEEVRAALEAGHLETQELIPSPTKTVGLFTRLLTEPIAARELARLAAKAGVDLNAELGVILIMSPRDRDKLRVHDGAQYIRREVPQAVEVGAGPVDLCRTLVVPLGAWSEAIRATESCIRGFPVTAVLVRPVAPKHLHREYHIAEDLASIAKKYGPHRAFEMEDLLIDWVLEDSLSRGKQFWEHVLSGILEHRDRTELLEVLTASFNGELQSSAAQTAQVSERSFRRYLRRARKLAGVDGTNDPAVSFRLNLAIRLGRLSSGGQNWPE